MLDFFVLWRLFPFAALGVVAGYVAMGHVDEAGMRRLMGVILTVLVGYQLWQYFRGTVGVRRDGIGTAFGRGGSPGIPLWRAVSAVSFP